MPVRSLSSPVLKWPRREEVLEALKVWVEELQNDPRVWAVGYFGSLAEDTWGVGSDVDLVIIIKEKNPPPFWERALKFSYPDLPVPADLLIYTLEEWARLRARSRWKIKWLFTRGNQLP